MIDPALGTLVEVWGGGGELDSSYSSVGNNSDRNNLER